MTSNSASQPFEDVFRRELQEIVKRRRAANLHVEVDEAGNAQTPADSLVGLALSGGGVRSAAFNLGLLQSLHEDDLLRHVDYMSTVSGGGYVGASLSSLALHPQTDFGWKTNHHEPAPAHGKPESVSGHEIATDEDLLGNRFSLTSTDDGRQPPRVLELIHGGGYLRRPLIFLNRYLIGVILTNIVALSMVFALAALAAWMFRWLDNVLVSSWVQVLGFRGDTGRTFFPTAVFFTFWLLMWAVSYWRSGSQADGRVARWFMTLTIVSFFLAFAALLGTGDIDFDYMREYFGLQVPEEEKRWVTGNLKTFLLIGLVLALLPYLRIRDLLRSGTHPRTAVEGWIFAIASRALLYGIPLVVFGWMARENISYYEQNRREEIGELRIDKQYNITPTDFVDWDNTWQQVLMLSDTRQANKKPQENAPLKVKDEALKDVNQRQAETTDVEAQSFSNKYRKDLLLELVAESLEHDTCSQCGDLTKRIVKEMFSETTDNRKSPRGVISTSLETGELIADFENSTPFLQRWILYLSYLFTPKSKTPHKLPDQVRLRLDYVQSMEDVCNHLNRTLLVNEALYQKFLMDDSRPIKAYNGPIAAGNRRAEAIQSEHDKLPDKAKIIEEKIRGIEASRDSNGVANKYCFLCWHAERYRRIEGIRELSGAARDKALSDLALFDSEAGSKDFAAVESELKAVNWKLLQMHAPEHLRPRGDVFSSIVWKADQEVRWSWFVWSLAVFLISACVVNMNATSLHGFYRKMLSRMWITEIPGLGRTIPLARLETVAKGAPYHLISAAIRMIGRKDDSLQSETDVFVFSQAFCGSNRTGYVPTEQYMAGQLDLSNAIAISGAAVTPTQVHNPLLAVLLMLSNSRLGQWLPNPSRITLLPSNIERLLDYLPPVPLRLMFGALQRPEDRNYCFVSDGGHHENLGIEPLLQRRCRLIIASDVTYDRKFEFTDFVRLLRRMRFEFGIRILGIEEGSTGVPLKDLTPQWILNAKVGDPDWVNVLSKENNANQHYIVARILYPDGGIDGSPTEGRLIYIKPNFDGDEAVDLTRYQVEDPSFPHDHTSDQFYDPQKFESYRQLGFHIGRSTYEKLFASQAMSDHHDEPLGKWALKEMRSSIAAKKA